MAKTDRERKQEQRERERLDEEERIARLLAYRLQLDVYKGTALVLDGLVERDGFEERQDLLTRLVHGAGRLAEFDPAAYAELIRLP
jgi:hypothetical protein